MWAELFKENYPVSRMRNFKHTRCAVSTHQQNKQAKQIINSIIFYTFTNISIGNMFKNKNFSFKHMINDYLFN